MTSSRPSSAHTAVACTGRSIGQQYTSRADLIAPQVRTLVEDGPRRSESMPKAGDDPLALAGGWWPDSRTPAVVTAAGDIDTYAQANCGFSFGPDGR